MCSLQAKISQSGLKATLDKKVPVVMGQKSEKFAAQLLQGRRIM